MKSDKTKATAAFATFLNRKKKKHQTKIKQNKLIDIEALLVRVLRFP